MHFNFNRRRLQFSLRTLFVILAVTAVVTVWLHGYLTRNPIEGTWQGTAGDERFLATFAGDSLVIPVGMHAAVEPRQSWFQVDPDNGSIDIRRDDGLQLGRYEVDGDTLVLKLADVNAPRPKDLSPNTRPHSERRYVFKRAR
jgi:hypothetical protein